MTKRIKTKKGSLKKVVIKLPKQKNSKQKLLQQKITQTGKLKKILFLILVFIGIILIGQLLVREISTTGKAIQLSSTTQKSSIIQNAFETSAINTLEFTDLNQISEMKVMNSGELPDNSGCWLTAGKPYYDSEGNSYQAWARKKEC